MNTTNRIAFVLVMICLASCADHPQDGGSGVPTVTTSQYDFAQNRKNNIIDRIEAASHLTDEEKQRLQTELFKEVPGGLDVHTLDAVVLLGEIGDAAAADQLEQFYNGSLYVPGKINSATSHAIKKIRARARN